MSIAIIFFSSNTVEKNVESMPENAEKYPTVSTDESVLV